MAKKVVITGGAGLLGVHIALRLRRKWECHCLYRDHRFDFENHHPHFIDLEKRDDVDKLIGTIRPHLIIHAAGLTSVEKCESHRKEAFNSNVLSACHVAEAAQKYRCQFVHVSTDHFSKDREPLSREDSIDQPINYYAQTKLEAEQRVQERNPKALIVRTNFFGRGHKRRKSFSDFIIENLEQENPLFLFEDVFFTPILMDDLLDSILILAKKEVEGVINVVGDDRLSKYDFGIKLAEIFNFNKNLIKRDSIKTRKELRTRPSDMSLSNHKLKTIIGPRDLSVETSLKRLQRDLFVPDSFLSGPSEPHEN